MSISLDEEWLNANSRVFPARMSTTIHRLFQNSDGLFTTVREGNPNMSFGNFDHVYVGFDNGLISGVPGGFWINRAYFSVPLDGIPAEARIDSAVFTISNRTAQWSNPLGRNRGTVAIYSVAEPWNIGINWLNQPLNGQSFIASDLMGANLSDRMHFDIRETVNDWVQGLEPNHGISIRMVDEINHQAEWLWTPGTAATSVDPTRAPNYVITFTIPDPVDPNMPLNNLSVTPRAMVERNITGLQRFTGVFLDGVSRPGSIVNYWIYPSTYSGLSLASLSYRFPNTETFEANFPGSNRFRDRISNWQSTEPLTNVQFDRLHRTHARAMMVNEVRSDRTIRYSRW